MLRSTGEEKEKNELGENSSTTLGSTSRSCCYNWKEGPVIAPANFWRIFQWS
jgi:hypothetical protein